MNEQTRTPEAVNGLTSEQLREKLRKIKCFMLDMDGTFYLGNQILPGAADFYIFNLFKNLTKKLHFYPVQ